MPIDAELRQLDHQPVRVLQLPHALIHLHTRVQLAVHVRVLAAQAGDEGVGRDLADDVALARTGRQLDRDGQLVELLRPAIPLEHLPVAHDLLALRLLRLPLARLGALRGELLLRGDDVVRLHIVA